jgi:hypothetical protein
MVSAPGVTMIGLPIDRVKKHIQGLAVRYVSGDLQNTN